MEKAKGLSEYQYNSSQLSHTYDYLATPLLTMLPPPYKYEQWGRDLCFRFGLWKWKLH